jgi:hypothetical protein
MAVLLMAVPASAQTPATPPTTPTAVPRRAAPEPPPPGSRWFLGALTGVQQVERSGPVLGLEFGVRVKKHLQIVLESGWMSDVVTDKRLAEMASFATYLQRTRQMTTTSDMDAPTYFVMAGVRLIPDRGWDGVRPYVMATAGLARVEYRPVFLMDGVDRTTSVSEFGVILGKDLLGPGNHFAASGGAGIVFGDKWYLDLGARFTRIQTLEHPTNVRRFSISVGHRF